MKLIMSSDVLKSNTLISSYINPVHLEKFIKLVQDIHIKPILKESFYLDLLDKVYNYEINGVPLSAEYSRLLNGDDFFSGLYDFMAMLTYYEYLKKANFKSTETGLKKLRDTTSDIVTELELSTYMDDIKRKSDFYKDELMKFLDNNYLDYPLYDKEGNCGISTASRLPFNISVIKKSNLR